MTDSTPLNTGDELRENLWHYMGLCPGTEHSPCIFDVYISPEQQFEGVMEFIIADRKKHELQAIQRVFDKVDRSTDFQEWNGTGIMFRDELLAELKQELEKYE